MSLKQYKSLHEFLEGKWENYNHKVEFHFIEGRAQTIMAKGTYFEGAYNLVSSLKDGKGYLLRDIKRGPVRLTIHNEMLIYFDGEQVWRDLKDF